MGDELGNFLSLSCFRGLSGQMFWMIFTMCAGWISSFFLISARALGVHGSSGRTCEQQYWLWYMLAVTSLCLTSFLFILRVRCLAVKYLQR